MSSLDVVYHTLEHDNHFSREDVVKFSGLVSVLFASEEVGVLLLAEASRRLESAGRAHAAAQAPSDRADLIAFYDKHFRRQGSFPILERRLEVGDVR